MPSGEETEEEEQKLCYACNIADEIYKAVSNDGVIHAGFTEPQPKLVHLTFLLFSDCREWKLTLTLPIESKHLLTITEILWF